MSDRISRRSGARARPAAAAALLALTLVACRAQSTRDGGSAGQTTSAAPVLPETSARASQDSVAAAPSTASRDTAPAVIGDPKAPTAKESTSGAARPIPEQAREKPVAASVREIRASDRLVGQVVRVSGRCVGDSPALVPGGPPRTRSDWQLAVGREAVYVSGEKPAPCRTGEAEVTITARVAQDTIHGLGKLVPRQYLVRLP